MKQMKVCLMNLLFTTTVNAGELCNMYGPYNVLCQSEQLQMELQADGIIQNDDHQLDDSFNILTSRCYNGDQAACDRLEAMMSTSVYQEPHIDDWAGSFDYGE